MFFSVLVQSNNNSMQAYVSGTHSEFSSLVFNLEISNSLITIPVFLHQALAANVPELRMRCSTCHSAAGADIAA